MGYALTDFGKIELLQVEWIDAVPANQLGHVIVVLGKYLARNGVVGLEDEATALGRVQLGENRCSVFFFDTAGQRLDVHVAASRYDGQSAGEDRRPQARLSPRAGHNTSFTQTTGIRSPCPCICSRSVAAAPPAPPSAYPLRDPC